MQKVSTKGYKQRNPQCAPVLIIYNLECLKRIAVNYLKLPFLKKRFSRALDSYGDKAFGLDSFNFKFLEVFWSLFKDDFLDMFSKFHSSSLFVKFLNTTFISLISNERAKNINDFSPICLVRRLYSFRRSCPKDYLVSYIRSLTSHGMPLLMIGKFLKLLTVNEMVYELIYNKKTGILGKLDMEKFFDHVS